MFQARVDDLNNDNIIKDVNIKYINKDDDHHKHNNDDNHKHNDDDIDKQTAAKY